MTYYEKVSLPFGFSSIAISLDLTASTSETLIEGQETPSTVLKHFSPIRIVGGIVQSDNPSKFALRLFGIDIIKSYKSNSALRHCIWLKTEKKLILEFSAVSVLCQVLIRAGEESSLKISTSTFENEYINVTLGPASSVWASATSFEKSSWTLSNASSLKWSLTNFHDDTLIYGTGRTLSFDASYCRFEAWLGVFLTKSIPGPEFKNTANSFGKYEKSTHYEQFETPKNRRTRDLTNSEIDDISRETASSRENRSSEFENRTFRRDRISQLERILDFKMVTSFTKTVKVASDDILNAYLSLNNHTTVTWLNGTRVSATVKNSILMAASRSKNARNQLSAASLIVWANCHADITISRCQFMNGTAFVIMETTNSRCASIGTSLRSNIFYNIFPAPSINYSFNYILKQPATPALGFFPSQNLLPLDSVQSNLVLNATHNYWASPLGPNICCNQAYAGLDLTVENGKIGAYTTNLIDVSRWCIDRLCTSTVHSNQIDSACIVYGCAQNFSRKEKFLFLGFFLCGAITVVIGLIIILIKLRRSGIHVKAYNLTRADIADESFSILALALVFAILGGAFACATSLPLILSTEKTSHLPHQLRMPLRGSIILWCLVFFSGLQIFLNAFILVAIIFRKGGTLPKLYSMRLNVIYIFNVGCACMGIMVGIGWTFYSGLNDLFVMFYLTLPSTLVYWVLFPIFIFVFASIITILPVYTFVARVKHYDYYKMQETIDQNMLAQLRKDEFIENSAERVRHWLFITAVTGTILCIITVMELHKDAYATPRYATVLVETILAILCLCLAIYTTYAFYRNHVIIVLLLMLILAFFGALTDLIFWVFYIVIGEEKRIVSTVIHLFVTGMWACVLSHAIIRLYKLREKVLILLPASIASNLNSLLDKSWTSRSYNSAAYGTIGAISSLEDSFSVRPSLLRAIEEDGIENGTEDDESDIGDSYESSSVDAEAEDKSENENASVTD